MEGHHFIALILFAVGALGLFGNLHKRSDSLSTLFVVVFYFLVVLTSFFPVAVFSMPFYVFTALLAEALFIKRVLPHDNVKARLFLGVIFPILFLLCGETFHYIGTNVFNGTSLLKAGILGVAVPILFHGVFSKLKFQDETRKKLTELAFYALFLCAAMFLSLLYGGLFALLSCLACFIGTYFLSHHVNAGGKETGWGVILTLLFLAMFKFLAEASNTKDIQLTNPSVLLGIFLGVAWMIAALFLVDSNERKGFWKPIYSKILLILLAFSLVYTCLLLPQYTGVGGNKMLLSTLIGVAVLTFFSSLFSGKQILAPSAIFVAVILLLLPAEKVVHTEKEAKGLPQYDSIGNNQAVIDTTDVGFVIKTKTDTTTVYKQPNFLQGTWEVDSKKSKLNFSIDAHDEVVEGVFSNYTGRLHLDQNPSQSYLKISIPVTSLSTANTMRDDNLKEDKNFFDIAKFPQITFQSTRIEVISEQNYTIVGTFSMRGVPKPMRLDVRLQKNADGTALLTGKGSLDRTQFGMPVDASMVNKVNFSYKVVLKPAHE